MATKKQLIEELNQIVYQLIEKGKLRYYPFTRSLNSMRKEWLEEGIRIYGKKLQEFELNKPKVWNCGHTEDEHCFADVMFCVRDPNWFENYKKEK